MRNTNALLKWFAWLLPLFGPFAMAAADCDPWAAYTASTEGTVEVMRYRSDRWSIAPVGTHLCLGDRVRVGEHGRASIVLENDTILRLDARSTLVLPDPQQSGLSFVELLDGALHLISRIRGRLEIRTPFVNAGLEGTEFVVRINDDEALVAVIEGRVAVTNRHGALRLSGGQTATARADSAPVLRIDMAPEDAVRWALHYPATVPSSAADAAQRVAEAQRLLSTGQADAAQAAIDAALADTNDDADALAVAATVALAQNRREEALRLSRAALASGETANALLASSYVQQAAFDLPAARDTLLRAVDRYPDKALLWSRLAELQAGLGEREASLQSATRATTIDPDLARTQTVLGFAQLNGTQAASATATFETAIALDPADPLARLGLGLAHIRAGDLSQGRREIEIAASLDPGNSLVRSYLGKAYAAEGRQQAAETELALARQFDPNDPSPWLYEALVMRDAYREVEAVRSFEQSVELNDRRAVFRSRFLLDDDLAARSSLIGMTYASLGLRRLGLVHADAALAANPGNGAAHGLRADLLRNQPRQGMARVSETLQARMLQPLSARPVRPSELIRELDTGAGSAVFSPGGSDYSSLFADRDPEFGVSTFLASHDTAGFELEHAKLFDNVSYSVGYFDYVSDGFRDDADVDYESYNAAVQWRVSDRLSLLFEARHQFKDQGDLRLGIDPRASPNTERRRLDLDVVQIGARAELNPRTQLLVSLANSERDEREVIVEPALSRSIYDRRDGQQAEVQLLHRGEQIHLIAGLTRREVERDYTIVTQFAPIVLPFPFPPLNFPPVVNPFDESIDSTSAYLYANWLPGDNVTLTLGASRDGHEDGNIVTPVDYTRTNPKAGVRWQFLPGATARAVYAETTKHQLVTEATLEPTAVAGFTQFYDDFNRTMSRLQGVALDLQFNDWLSSSIEFTEREIDTVDSETEIIEKRLHGSLAAIINDRLTASIAYQRQSDDVADGRPFTLRTNMVPIKLSYRAPEGYFADLIWTVFDQEWKPDGQATIASSFNAVDVAGGYRWGRNRYKLSFGISDLLDDIDEYRDDRHLSNDQLNVIRPFVPGRTFWGSIQLAWD